MKVAGNHYAIITWYIHDNIEIGSSIINLFYIIRIIMSLNSSLFLNCKIIKSYNGYDKSLLLFFIIVMTSLGIIFQHLPHKQEICSYFSSIRKKWNEKNNNSYSKKVNVDL